MLDLLRRWWIQKYKLPSNHECFLDSSPIELLTEFWEDFFYDSPIEAYRQPDGTVKFEDTGDPLVDKWEKELADGKIPDYMEAFTPEQLERLQSLRTRGKTKFGRSVGTMRDVMDSVSADAVRHGLIDPSIKPYYPLRFKDDDEPSK